MERIVAEIMEQHGVHSEPPIELHSAADLESIIAELFPKLVERRCPTKDQLVIRSALEKTILHFFQGASRDDAAKKLLVRLYLSEKFMIATVKKADKSFEGSRKSDAVLLDDLPRETKPPPFECPDMTWLRFDGENSVTMCKSWYGG